MSEILTSPRPSRFGRAVGFRLAGIGGAVPDRVVTNADLARLGCDPEWIVARSGIHERRHAAPHEATSDLAAAAGRAALAAAGAAVGDVDLLVLGTFTPDTCIPSTACIVQEKLGLDAPAMDVTAACAGFAYALVTAANFLAAGSSRLVLAIGADTNSRFVDPEDVKTWPLFGDGAGAVLLEAAGPDATGRERGLLAFSLGSDGRGADLLVCPMSGTRQPVFPAGRIRPGRLQQHRPRPVAEQRPGLDVFGIDDAGVGVGADHQGQPARPSRDEVGRGHQRIREAGTGGRHVHRRGVEAERLLDQTGGRGNTGVGREGAEHEQVDVGRRRAGPVDRRPAGRRRQVARRRLGGRVPPLVNAGAGHDPLRVAAQPSEVGIGDHPLGHRRTDPGQPKPDGAAET